MAFLRRPRPVAPPGTFDRLDDVRASIRELYTRLSGPAVKAFGPLVLPPLPGRDPLLEAQQAAAAMTRHLGIGDARVIVAFSPLGGHVGEVELGPGPEYFITLSPHYRDDPRDIAAVLAHEVTHVFLHRHGFRQDEIFTDTATLYLGIGRAMLAAYRVEVVQSVYTRRRTTSRVGYLSPPEMGYVLAKRALAFDEEVRPFTGAANGAYRLGHRLALDDYARPPLAGASHGRYAHHKRTGRATDHYRFEAGKVAFPCPACGHGTRVPVDRNVKVRCAVCRSVFGCET